MPIFVNKRKVQHFGSSYAMTLPMLFVKGNEITKGLEGETYFGFDGVLVTSFCKDQNKIIEGLSKIIDKLNENIMQIENE